METRDFLGVTNRQAFQFFFEHLRDVTYTSGAPANELHG